MSRGSSGASGGILTAWDAAVCSLSSTVDLPYTLTTGFSLLADNMPFTLSNVYAPTLREDKAAFLSELASVAEMVSGAWMLLGDFNLTRCPEDKNNANYCAPEANRFNELINSLGLIEIPLVDRAFTWSNRRDCPTLVRLDRCFINLDWDASFPNTALSSLTRFASDHVPLSISACTRIPRSNCFRFENSWLLNRQFPSVIQSALAETVSGHTAKSFVQRLKHCRGACRSWSRRQLPLTQREFDTKVLINALDLLEEARPLCANEAALRQLAVQGLQSIHAGKLEFWRQCFNLRVALEWDENSHFFHAAASGRRRANTIACLELDGLPTTAHDAKSTILYNFYMELLGRGHSTEWRFDLLELYPHMDVASCNLSMPFSNSEITEALWSLLLQEVLAIYWPGRSSPVC